MISMTVRCVDIDIYVSVSVLECACVCRTRDDRQLNEETTKRRAYDTGLMPTLTWSPTARN